MLVQTSGFGGTTAIDDGARVEGLQKVNSRPIRVRFNSDVGASMVWKFKPQQSEIQVGIFLIIIIFFYLPINFQRSHHFLVLILNENLTLNLKLDYFSSVVLKKVPLHLSSPMSNFSYGFITEVPIQNYSLLYFCRWFLERLRWHSTLRQILLTEPLQALAPTMLSLLKLVNILIKSNVFALKNNSLTLASR